MYPTGRIFQAENGQIIEPETEVYVVDVLSNGQEILVQIVDSDETFTLTETQMTACCNSTHLYVLQLFCRK